MAAPRVRPLLLVDVDGVLLVVGGWDEDGDGGYEPSYVPDAGEMLRRLSADFELHWATTWEASANVEIAPALGLPPLPFVRFDFDYRARTPKLRSVMAYVGDRPCAWIDDDLGPDAVAWAAGRSVPTLLVHADPAEGMARRHVDELRDFAASLG